MKIMVAGLDCTEVVHQAYREASDIISLPPIADVNVYSYASGRDKAYARGGMESGKFVIKFNGTVHKKAVEGSGLSESEILEDVIETTKHEAIHVHQVYTKVPCKHNKYFTECLEKLGLKDKFGHLQEKAEEAKNMKNEVGMINIDALKESAKAMNVTFEDFLKMTGMSSLVEKAQNIQTKEKEKEEVENLKSEIEIFKSRYEPQLNLLFNEIEADFNRTFTVDERERIDFDVKASLKVNLKGSRSSSGGTRTSGGPRSHWALKIGGAEIETPDGYKTVWGYLENLLCDAKKIETPISAFSQSLTPSHLCRKFCKSTTESWRDDIPRLQEYCNLMLEKAVEIIEN